MVQEQPPFATLRLDWPGPPGVLEVALNRPRKSNAVDRQMWHDLKACFGTYLVGLADLRCVVLTGGMSKNFCAGLDLGDTEPVDGVDVARTALRTRTHVLELQASLDALEALAVPVVAAVHGACYGAGLDMICACDIRWACDGARFSIKEVDVGLCADVGVLARLPKIVGNSSLVHELAYSARPLRAAEALSAGLTSRTCADLAALRAAAFEFAATVASKSPVAIVGTKNNLLYARDHTVADANERVAVWNAACLQTDDLVASVGASRGGVPATFSKL